MEPFAAVGDRHHRRARLPPDRAFPRQYPSAHRPHRMMLRPNHKLVPSLAWCGVLVVAVLAQRTAGAQNPAASLPTGGVHFLTDADMPPGALGQAALMRRRPVHGYYQPVALYAPGDAQVSIAAAGSFQSAGEGSVGQAAMLVGAVYRLKITNIPNQPGVELFPTVEIIDRLYPPPGREAEFPIPIHIDADDLFQAIEGRLVTRVVYLEDPQTALPVADAPQSQRSYDVRPDMDPLHEADRMGRPVAVLRIGSRVPPTDGTGMDQFLMGSPPWLPRLVAEPTTADVPSTTVHGTP